MIKNIIGDLKLGLRLLKYGFRPKMNLGFCAFFILLGLVVEILSKGEEFLGVFYMLMSSIYAFQMIISMDISTMVQTSRMKYALQTSIPVITSAIISLAIYTVIVIERLLFVRSGMANVEEVTASLFAAVIMMSLTLLYTGFCYKYFVFAMVLLCFSAPVFLIVTNVIFSRGILTITLGNVIPIGYACILIGALGEYLLCRIFYKKDISNFAFRGIFSKMDN